MKENYQLKITVWGYGSSDVDEATNLVVDQLSQFKLKFKGPQPWPNKRSIVTTLISPHKHKDAQEQFERITHWRKIFVSAISPSTFKKLEEELKVKILPNVCVEMKDLSASS